MSDSEVKKEDKEDDRVSEMEEEVPICCFAFELICCPQKYWNISKRPGEVSESDDKSEDGKEEEDKEEKKDDK